MIAVSSMPGTTLTDTPVVTSKITSTPLANVQYHPLHPTFGAEVTGVDFGNVTDKTVAEIKRGLAIVSMRSLSTSKRSSTVH